MDQVIGHRADGRCADGGQPAGGLCEHGHQPGDGRFRQPGWTDNPPRTDAFEHTAAQQNDLERQTYEAWTSDQLAAHGFTSVPRASARYVVRLDYSTATRLVQVRQPVYPDPYWGSGALGAMAQPLGASAPWGPQYVDTNVQVPFYAYHVEIDEAATGKRVYQVTAQTQGGG